MCSSDLVTQVGNVVPVEQAGAGSHVRADPHGELARQGVHDLPGKDRPRLIVRAPGATSPFPCLGDRPGGQPEPARVRGELAWVVVSAGRRHEPDPRGVLPTEDASWACWLKGGSSCPGFVYKVAGMQTLINTVRAAGAHNVIMAGGLSYANDLTEWLKYEPRDPDHNLAASWHSYNFNRCNNQQCWTSEVGPVADKVPLIAGEIGETDCADNYIDPLMAYLDSKGASYLAWSWNAAGDCAGGPELITDYNGDPTPYGAGYESHLQALAKRSH